jgi:hypothetical protein
MAAIFPSSLPWFTRFVLSPAGQRSATQPPKHFAQRSNTASGWAKAEVGWVFFEEQRATFEEWFRDNLKRGASWALMKLPITPGGIAGSCYSAVRFPNGYTKALVINGLWRVSAEIVIRDRFECAVAPQLDPLTLLQSRYISLNDDDESYYQRGSPSVIGSPAVGSGFVQITGDDASYLEYPTATPNGVDGVTFEAILDWAATDNFSYTTALEVANNIAYHRFGFLGTNGTYVYDNGGFGVEATSGPHIGETHVSSVFDNTSARSYINGLKVWEALGDATLPASPISVRIGDPFSTAGKNYRNVGFRLRQESVYVGDSFTPPTVIPSPYL